MNGSEVACSSPATPARRVPTSPRYGSAGRPRTTSSAATNSGTIAGVDAPASSASRSKRTPVVTKNAGRKKPKPIASSLRRKSGCVISWSASRLPSLTLRARDLT